MTIKVVCQCGASFGAKDELAGRSVACPKCKQSLKIGATPAPAAPVSKAMTDLLDEAGFDDVQGPRCPKCTKPIQTGSLMCVSCGFNLQTGEVVEGAEIQLAAERGDKGVSNMLLNSATNRIAQEKLEDRKTRAQGTPIWVLFVGLFGVLAFVACMLFMPRDEAFYYNGWGLIVFGSFIILAYGIRVIISAFVEHMNCGLLMFVPFYSLYYIFTRWSRVGGFFSLQMLGLFFILLGWGMVAISPNVGAKEGASGILYLHERLPPAVVVSVDFECNRLLPLHTQVNDRTRGIGA